MKKKHKSGLAFGPMHVMLLLSSLKGTLFLFRIVTDYVIAIWCECAQIKSDEKLPSWKRKHKHIEKKLKQEKTGQLHGNIEFCSFFSEGANGESFFSRLGKK